MHDSGDGGNGKDRKPDYVLAVSVVMILLLLAPLYLAGHIREASAAAPTTDFNGDAYEDLAIGVPFEDIGTPAISDAGAVNVIYGSSSGLRATKASDDTGRSDQLWHQNSPNVDGAASSGDNFGFSLATGDFNGDGYSDLVVGVPNEDLTITDVGAINVIYGSSKGLSATPATDGTGRYDEFWNQDRNGIEDSAEEDDHFGYSLAAGDFNNDGYSDLAIGVPFEDIGSPAKVDAGGVNVIYGSSAGLRAAAASDGTGRSDQFWSQDTSGVDDTAEGPSLTDIGDSFGSSLATGNFNNDGYDDLAVGVFGEDTGNNLEREAGAVNVLYGAGSGLRASASGTTPADQFWRESTLSDTSCTTCVGSPFVQGNDDNFFGWSLAAGDFNNDGYDDLAIGVPNEPLSEGAFMGAVYAIYGSSSGLQVPSPASQVWFQDNLDTDEYGSSLAAGDFNNDGYDDLAIGSPQGITGTNVAGGGVHVLYGSASRLQDASPEDQFWHQNSPNVDEAEESNDEFGSSLTTGDFNNDGYCDLAVGVPLEDVGLSNIANAGAVNVIYGSSAGLSAISVSGTGRSDQLWHQNKSNIEDSAEVGDRFGFSLTGSPAVGFP